MQDRITDVILHALKSWRKIHFLFFYLLLQYEFHYLVFSDGFYMNVEFLLFFYIESMEIYESL